ncbi:hypothetical protein RRG08_035286 [Elysia crispata]|uniref:Uncharacterized protein n=1 Tax=Elysia crispata TaxID=231223 RepID=A0AAE0ZXF8_9GAST|nr:hypothetical protein RRG08_035286 [Elysia crispata]
MDFLEKAPRVRAWGAELVLRQVICQVSMINTRQNVPPHFLCCLGSSDGSAVYLQLQNRFCSQMAMTSSPLM